MPKKGQAKGPMEIQENVLASGLCTNCGACVNLCPYIVTWKDRTLFIHSCDREDGRCYAFCPRTPTDLGTLRQALFDAKDLTPELGAIKGFYMTRSADEGVRRVSQHGGTVTTLIMLALEEGLIDACVLAEEGEEGLPHGITVSNPSEVKTHGRSKLVVSPTLAEFNKIVRKRTGKIGVVTTPCQAMALAKMRLGPLTPDDAHLGKIQLVIGLFCGWAFSWKKLDALLRTRIAPTAVIGLDIPPSRYHSLEVHTQDGIIEIPLDEVLPCVREGCRYCSDMTAEFSDISVGSARCPEGWEVARSWNQVIVRTPIGQELLELARAKGLLEFREMPEGNLERLKRASLNKKKLALTNLIEKTGDPEDLLYLDPRDPVLAELIG